MRRAWIIVGFALLTASCGQELKFNLIVYDSCSQFPLQSGELSFLEVLIESDSFGQPVREIFDFDSGRGAFEGLSPVPDAIVTVIGRAADGNAEPGLARAASSVGLVDLSGSNGTNVVQISVVVGSLDTFISTTNTDVANQCTQQVVPRRGHTSTVLDDGRVLIAGGSELEPDNRVRLWTATEIYNPRTGFFVAGPELRNGREGHSATRLDDGRVLVAGGESGDAAGTLRAAQVFSPEDNTFGSSVGMLEKRAYHSATLLGDGRVMLAGGIQRDSGLLVYTGTTEVYDPATDRFTPGPTLQQPRAFHRAVRVSANTIALIGGLDEDNLVASIEFLSPDRVLTGPSLGVPRSHLAAALIPGRDAVFVAGGFDSVLEDPTRPATGTGTASYEILALDPAELAASQILCSDRSLQTRRGDPALAAVPGGFVVAGGIEEPRSATATAERVLFAGASDLCRPTPSATADSVFTEGPMLLPRAGFRLSPLIGGDLLSTGGYTLDETLPVGTRRAQSARNAELYIIGR